MCTSPNINSQQLIIINHQRPHLQDDVFLLLFGEGGPLWVDTGVGVGGRHEELRSPDDVVLVRVVLEQDVVIVGPRPVANTLQH